MITESKKLKIAFTVFSIFCVITVLSALITDFILLRRITWSAYVAASMPFVWLVVSPLLLLKKHRFLGAMGVFTLALLPYLFVIEKTTPRDWFYALAVPIGVAVILAMWLSFVLIRLFKIRKWYLAAACVFIWAVLVNFTTQYFVHRFLGDGFLSFDLIINIISNMGCVILLGVVGYYSGKLEPKSGKSKGKNKASEESSELVKVEPDEIPAEPDIKMPGIKMPDIKIPDIKTPDIKTPDVTAPEIKTHDIAPPDLTGTDIHITAEKAVDLEAKE